MDLKGTWCQAGEEDRDEATLLRWVNRQDHEARSRSERRTSPLLVSQGQERCGSPRYQQVMSVDLKRARMRSIGKPFLYLTNQRSETASKGCPSSSHNEGKTRQKLCAHHQCLKTSKVARRLSKKGEACYLRRECSSKGVVSKS